MALTSSGRPLLGQPIRSAASVCLSAGSAWRTFVASHAQPPAPPQAPPGTVRAEFWRGGTSRGLLFRPSWFSGSLAHDRAKRDALICAAMGSPDPDGRQISGLGGGLSSLSKCAIIGRPGEIEQLGDASASGSGWPGHDQVEDTQRARDGWDVVYRFGQVPINDGTKIDWGSTCGNLVSAVAMFAIDSGVIDQAALQSFVEQNSSGTPFPLRIIAANSGNIVTANVPLERAPGSSMIRAARTGSASIAGVPGTHAPVSIETPLPPRETLLPSGAAHNEVTVPLDDAGATATIPVTLIDCGLPVIFVPATSLLSVPSGLGLPSLDLLRAHPSELDAHAPTMRLLERIRSAAAQQLSARVWAEFSPPAPKVCVVHPRTAYASTGGDAIASGDMDLLIRAVSVGNVHRTIPATTLSALAAASAFKDSVVAQAIREGQGSGSSAAATGGEPDVVTVTVGQPAGLSSASVKLDGSGDPQSIVYLRTANRILAGHVDVPADLL